MPGRAVYKKEKQVIKMIGTWFLFIAAALAISLVLGVVLCKVLIPVLHKFKFGQNVREEGPKEHLKKAGTPTMGGIAIVIAFCVGALAFCGISKYTIPVVICTVLFGLIGFLDDYLKIKKKQSEGLKAWQKMGLQIIVTVMLLVYIICFTKNGTETIVPFFGTVDFKAWLWPLGVFAILGTVNGANFTDGLDGLAGSVTIVISVFLTAACAILIPELAMTPAAMIGALIAFLIYNHYPAKLFMGDTGSLALGGFAAAMAFVLKIPIFLIFFAFIYLIEIISVILQVLYFKKTGGKRLFRMAPIHHHFELGGWSENKVVIVFSAVTLVLSAVAFIGLVIAA